MRDIVERLANGTTPGTDLRWHVTPLHKEAATTITELRAEVEAKAAWGAKLRGLVAKLYCASGCSCCRDDDAWYAAASELGDLLAIPKYDDGSGHDFYNVRDEARATLEGPNP